MHHRSSTAVCRSILRPPGGSGLELMRRILTLLFLAGCTFAQTGIPSLNNIGLSSYGTITLAGTSCTAVSCVWLVSPAGTTSVAVSLAGTFTGSLNFEESVNGTAWVVVNTFTAAGTYSVETQGSQFFRVRATSLGSGSVKVTLAGSTAPAASVGAGGGFTDDGTNLWAQSRNITFGGQGGFTALSGDATSTSTGGVTVVTKTNGTPFGALATEANPTAAQTIAGFTACSGTQYLGADGSCHTAASGFTALSGDATSTSTGGVTVVTKTNGTPFGALATEANPTAAQTIAGFTACSGTQYLGADGSCHTAASGFTALSGDATSTSTGGVTVVTKTNGTPFGALATEANPTAAQTIAGFTACSGTQYLGADGSCHTAASGFTALSGDATSTSTGGVTVVTKTNGTPFGAQIGRAPGGGRG